MIFSSTVAILALLVSQSLALHFASITEVAPNPQPPAPADVYCDRHTEPFVTARFNPSDCHLAIRYLESNISHAGSTEYEFRAPFAVSRYPNTEVRTPRCFSYDTCTVAVAMLVLFDPTALKVWSPLPSDLSAWGAVLGKAMEVSDTCLDHFRPSTNDLAGAEGADLTKRFVNPWGYSVVGQKKAVGVFVWDSWSIINQAMCKRDLASHLNDGIGMSEFTNHTVASPE